MAAKAESLKLLTKADWPEWYDSVTSRAERDGIWEYCNPDLLSAAAAPQGAHPALVLRELVEPTRPSHTDIDADATQLADLDAEDLKRWAVLKDDYSERMRSYREKHRAMSDLDDYIRTSLARSHHRLIRNLRTPYEKLKVLKQKLEPTSNQLQQSAQAAYDRAQKWNSRIKLED
jgi:hypothetical protein